MVEVEGGVVAPPGSGGAGRGPSAVLALLLVGHVALYLGLHANFDHDFDTQHYARIAWEMASGEFALAPHPFSQRFAITVPTALAYATLGVNAITTTLWTLIVSLAAVVAVYRVARRVSGPWTGVLAAFLLAVNVVQARHTSRILPDIVVSTFMLIAVSLLQVARDSSPGSRQRWLGDLCAVLLFAGLLAKGSVVWAGAFFAILLVADVARRRNVPLWTGFVLASVAGSFLFLAAYQIGTGDALYRLAGIEGTHNVRNYSFHGKSPSEYFERLTYGPLLFLLRRPGYSMLLALALPGLVHLVRPIRALPPGTRYWAAYFATILLVFWFGSTSLSAYNPLPPVERFLMPVLAPLSILGAITLARLVFAGAHTPDRRLGLILVAAAFAASAAAQWNAGTARAALQGACCLLVLGLAFLRPASRGAGWAATLARTALVLLLLAPIGLYVREGERSPPLLRLERGLVRARLDPLREPTIVFADRHSTFVLPFLLAREAREFVRIVWWGEAEAFRDAPGRKLVYIHQPRVKGTHLNWGFEVPDFINDRPPSWVLVGTRSMDQRYWISLFEIPSVDTL